MSGPYAIAEVKPQIWNPDEILGIHIQSRYTFCVGAAVTRGNARCRWQIIDDRLEQVRKILDEMGRISPSEISGSQLLSRLAQLSLCEEWHQYQQFDVLRRWNRVISDVSGQYEQMDKLHRVVRGLDKQLVIEREEREQLQKLIAAQSTKNETRESDLLLRSKNLENSLTESHTKAERLRVQNAELYGELEVQRQASKEYRIIMREELDDLKAKLTQKSRISAEREKDLELTTGKINVLQSQLTIHRERSEKLRHDLDKTTSDRTDLLAQIERSRAQSAIESESVDQLKTKLDEAERNQADLVKEKTRIQSLLADKDDACNQLENQMQSLRAELDEAERNQADLVKEKTRIQSLLADKDDACNQLENQVESLRAELASAQENLSQTRKVNEEQAAAYAVSQAASSAERTRLIEEKRRLEKQFRFPFWSAFTNKIKGLKKSTRSG